MANGILISHPLKTRKAAVSPSSQSESVQAWKLYHPHA